jgi:pyruvate/2-oxoglutarate dehydrogenase complex dihydrolipoamide dehydrogenase (E3) component
MPHFDAIVIGTGQAGPALAARLAKAGRRTAVIERHRFGGTCVNTGCIPTKTLVASARAIHMARRGAEFGFTVGGDLVVDLPRVRARKDEIVRESNQGVERWMKHTPNLTVFEGHGRFTGPRTVAVNGECLDAEQIFIDVGGRALVPDMPGVADVPILTNTSLLALEVLPDHLIIVGGSYIGLEFAQIYRRFGSRVTVVEKADRLIAREDEDVSTTLQGVLAVEGIKFPLSTTSIALAPAPGGVSVGVDCTRGAPTVEGSHVLLAVGRRPNTDDLGLEAAGVAIDRRGYITVDDQCRTNVAGIWALGECNGRGAFTHTAYHDYEVVSANLLDGDPRRISERIPCYALYTDPPVGRVGMTTQEARESGRRVLVAHRPMTKVSRAREMSETHGFMRALVDADTRKLLGAVVFGAGGDEIVHALADVMYADAPYTVISRAVHIHPTISELIPTMLQDLTPLVESLET